MTAKRIVTEADFRKPEFLDAKIEDYEFRSDGKLVRKDRWEKAVMSLSEIVGLSTRDFEIEALIVAVSAIAVDAEGWTSVESLMPDMDVRVDMRLRCGSVLKGGLFQHSTGEGFKWNGLTLNDQVVDWREFSTDSEK